MIRLKIKLSLTILFLVVIMASCSLWGEEIVDNANVQDGETKVINLNGNDVTVNNYKEDKGAVSFQSPPSGNVNSGDNP